MPVPPRSNLLVANQNVLLFAALCLVWGLTWIPIKIGTAVVPPLLFAAARFFTAGIVLAIISQLIGHPLPQRPALPRLIAVAILTVTLTYGPLFWGAARIDSGLAAVINLSLIPIGLIAASALLEKHRPQSQQILACLIGLPGLALLFLGGSGRSRVEGIVAIVVGTISYCIGSVLSRRIPAQPTPVTVSAVCNTLGALLLGLWAIAAQETQQFRWANVESATIVSWLFLVVFGSVFGFTVYLHLLQVWGAGRAGMYAFLSPIVAVLAGAIALQEAVTLKDGLGMALMVIGASIALKGRNEA
ncbi:EamA family transporter [Phormidium tenue FACHB-886]|nr:EamA family transporter [Phormidium tenue FACHB-886]